MKTCCVLIPYFNAGDSLLTSIASIDYNYCTPEVIVVDDGSKTIKAADILKKYNGPLKLILVELQDNKGIEHALNKGLELHGHAYKFIARLDCGDICKNNRLEKQIKFLEENPSYYLVGTWVDFINMEGNHLYTVQHPAEYRLIKKLMYINTTFTHPTVVFRSETLKSVGFYPTDAPAAEDYAYFFNIIKKHPASNIQESLIDCIIDPNGISTKKRKTQIRSRISVIVKNFNFNGYAIYGLIRSAMLLHTPRKFTVFLNMLLRPNQ
ncbi:glycosyltransferase [Pseudomonas vancouverensis]|uniref:Glycosyltransferase n=1 Tax=Pseudomonas vancouverensis TaxID=95300 RepID=A0A1H2MPZ0_PSEVA|nr:glycosyltransferase [Pseudomonas vancouverensis]KAB0494587.1 glycosyltransferase [Pseudomonas vancouverensis]TDB59253.1 glycosyltransferase [Pseudomonas vancouverensis]SDU95134.1 Glycosyl transferase family 2 [Pseudomonas vancouverensis]